MFVKSVGEIGRGLSAWRQAQRTRTSTHKIIGRQKPGTVVAGPLGERLELMLPVVEDIHIRSIIFAI